MIELNYFLETYYMKETGSYLAHLAGQKYIIWRKNVPSL